jgi:acetate kinase
MNILVPNLGSTSLKYQFIEMPSGRTRTRGRVERVSDYARAIASIRLDSEADAVAFKVVHGGEDFRDTVFIDDGVIAALERFLPAAPAHNAIYLAGIEAFRRAMPGARLIAAFETEFHATMPEYAAVYGVPGGWRREQVRRYGFHGASHEYAAGRVPEIVGAPVRRLINCHLGGSASICAIFDGRSIDTTMGFSPQSGIENATRPGDVDAFAVLYMMERHGWTVKEAREQLARNGGLAGLSGIAGGDVRDLEAAAGAGSAGAGLALEVCAYQVRKTIGAYSAALGGLDALAFTGGIGENSSRLRERCCDELGFLGVELDAELNRAGKGDRVISPEGSRVKTVLHEANEELVVARRAYRLFERVPL